ncbi:MAG: universal stress protein [Acidimicrobiales bacterium]|jgi:nucleotide-binding universal stress UspA family protein|nr:universal stress protein [Acidimicrobiales bacterium]
MATHPVLIVGVDGSPAARHALGTAAKLAVASGACLVAVHVRQVPAIVYAAPVTGAGELAAANELAADHAHIDCELVLAGHDISWTFETRHGDAATELQRAADDHDAACIVVGRHGHRLVTRVLTGSVTGRLVHHAHRPVLVVPPPNLRPPANPSCPTTPGTGVR